MPLLQCSGEISQTVEGFALCSTGWTQAPAPVLFDVTQIDPAVATSFFSAGFVLVIVPWATAWGISQMFRLLR